MIAALGDEQVGFGGFVILGPALALFIQFLRAVHFAEISSLRSIPLALVAVLVNIEQDIVPKGLHLCLPGIAQR